MINLSQQPGITITVKAAEDLDMHFLVGVDGKKAVAGAVPIGVCQLDTGAGRDAPVAIYGALIVVAKGAIAAGDDITTGASGTATKNAAGKSIGFALTAAADGELFKMILR